MFKKFCLLSLSVFLFISCAGSAPFAGITTISKTPGSFLDSLSLTTSSSIDSFFNSFPAEKGLVFIGAAGKRSDAKETVQFALEDAARRVALFHKVSGEYAVENNIGSGAFDYTNNTYTSIKYDEEGSRQFVSSLQFDADTDTIEIENTLIVRTIYPFMLPIPVRYRPSYGKDDHKPDWVDNPTVEIEGYETGVGHSSRLSSLAGTFTNSYQNAVFAIIRNINTTSRSADLVYQNTGDFFGYKTSSDNVNYSYGTLSGFYILDTWLDPKTKSVWTLAIAEKAN
jgi:hypothetical protein